MALIFYNYQIVHKLLYLGVSDTEYETVLRNILLGNFT